MSVIHHEIDSTPKPPCKRSVTIYPSNPFMPPTVFHLPKPAPAPPIYNKHRDGEWPDSEEQRAYIKQQRAAYQTNLVRLYYAFQDKMSQRLAELGDPYAVTCETSIDVQAQAHYLYYDQVWNKRPSMNAPDDFLVRLYRFWRDVAAAQEHRMYDALWEFVAGRNLPRKLLTAAYERKPRN